ncbi:hypothetical protein E4T56_gene4607 [Termitomyces sp. T112]|nr:hypothetical protein E4T56_gene4607 [Termitomyces sp. T112]
MMQCGEIETWYSSGVVGASGAAGDVGGAEGGEAAWRAGYGGAQAVLEAERRREEWLVNKAALGQWSIMHKILFFLAPPTDGVDRLDSTAQDPPQQSVSCTGLYTGWLGMDAQEPPPGVGTGCGADGEAVGGALAAKHGGTQNMVQGHHRCGGTSTQLSGGAGHGGGPDGGRLDWR